MSIYDMRDTPAYRWDEFEPYHNRNIDKWWSSDHDKMISQVIDKFQWNWAWEISDAVLPITPKDIGDTLNYNKVMKYAITRAKELGLDKVIRQPQWKRCPLCGNPFIEDSLPHPFVRRLGIDHLDFCGPCLRDTVLSDTGKSDATREEITEYLKNLSEILKRIPTQGFGEGIEDLIEIDYKKRLELLHLFKNKPTVKRVKEVFGSWLNALIEGGILENSTRETTRGIQTIANDGHICFSLGEKTIDDYLYKHGIPHLKESKYPEGNYRTDFLVGEIFIEYFGLVGDSEYDRRVKGKLKLCQKYGKKLIAIYPKDLVNIEKLKKKLFELHEQHPSKMK